MSEVSLLPARSRRKLLVFDTHPIQYRSPVFRELYGTHRDLKVFFFNEHFDATHWWFHEVGQIPRQQWRLPLLEGFPNETLHTASLGLRKSFLAFRRCLIEESPQAVLIYGYYQWEHWMLRLLTAELKIPLLFVGETFGEGKSMARRFLKRTLLSWFFSGVSQFITIGIKTRDHYRKRGIPASRLTFAKYCTDNTFFSVGAEQGRKLRREWRAKNSIPNEAMVLLFVGRLVDRKRPLDMLDIHRRLPHSKDLYTVIAGNGLLECELKERAAQEPSFRLLGFQDQHQVRNCYYGADLLVVPSRYESWGLVVNEAFSCGLPALVTEKCGVSGDLVTEDQTGYTFPVGDCAKAARIVDVLLSDRARLTRLGQSAREKVEGEYSIGQFAQAILLSLSRA